MRLFTFEQLIDYGQRDFWVDLPTGYMIRRTILEYGDFEIKKITLDVNTHRYNTDLYLETPPILGLLNGTTILHQKWGVIDYRLLAPDVLCEAMNGLRADKAAQALLIFTIGEVKESGILKCYHEVSWPDG